MIEYKVRQKVSFIWLLARKCRLILGWFLYQLSHPLKIYRYFRVDQYDYHESRLSEKEIEIANDYVAEAIDAYTIEHNTKGVSGLSQYYPYRKISKIEGNGAKIKVVNIGCFYAGAEALFLKENPNSEVYGLDFGNIKKVNSNLTADNLFLYEGYPLDSLIALHDENESLHFDYAIFVRTATKINIEQMYSYMEILKEMAENIIFLEVAKLVSRSERVIDISKIDIDNPLKLYGGLYLHNYPRLLEKFGYQILESEILSASTFPNQSLTTDHNFIFIHGKKNIAR